MKIKHTLPDGKTVLLWDEKNKVYIADFIDGKCVKCVSFHNVFAGIAAFCDSIEKNAEKQDLMYDRFCRKALAEGYDKDTGRKRI